jgi:hypothetical protein
MDVNMAYKLLRAMKSIPEQCRKKGRIVQRKKLGPGKIPLIR